MESKAVTEGRGQESRLQHAVPRARARSPHSAGGAVSPHSPPRARAHPRMCAMAARKKSRSKCCSTGSQRSSGAASRLTLKSWGAGGAAAAVDIPVPATDGSSSSSSASAGREAGPAARMTRAPAAATRTAAATVGARGRGRRRGGEGRGKEEEPGPSPEGCRRGPCRPGPPHLPGPGKARPVFPRSSALLPPRLRPSCPAHRERITSSLERVKMIIQ